MIAVIHSGQGAQQIGMFDGFSSPIFRDTITEASDILGLDIYNLVTHSTYEELSLTKNTQVCVTAMNVAIDRLWKHYNGPVHYRAGHSVGEYSAYCSAGSFSFADMLHAVRYRSSIMSDEMSSEQGGMLSIKDITKDEILKLISDENYDIEIACYNATTMHMVSGLTESLLLFKKRLEQLNIDHTLATGVSMPFHSRFMNSCVPKMKSFLKNVDIKLPLESVVNGFHINDNVSVDEITNGLSQQISAPVKWVDTLKFLVRKKVNNFVVFGSDRSYYHVMGQTTFPEFKTYLVHDIESLEKLLITLNYE